MNKIYRLIWSELVRAWVVVAETSRARGKDKGSVVARIGAFPLLRRRFIAKPLVVALSGAMVVHAAPPTPTQLPTGGQVAAGQATISTNGNTMNVTQTSQNAVVNWQTFNVGSAATVNFQQPSANAAILNRVLDSNPSQIYGSVNAPGQVFFVNPAGVYFGATASVNVGSLVATTHGIADNDFMSGNYRFTRNGATGGVINDGQLRSALGGYIALLAPEVRNRGVVVAQLGTVALAAGETYQLQFGGNHTLAGIQVSPATIAALVENGNAVRAPGGLIILSAQAADRLQGGVVRNTGSLEATGLTSDGGTIQLSASDTIRQSGTINADAATQSAGKGGTVTLIADLGNSASLTTVDGTLSARGGNLGGDGGFVETSASNVKIADSAMIDTRAPRGKTGTWLIDPNDFMIAASGGDITGAALSARLATSDVTISSDQGGGYYGNPGGRIFVNDPVLWTANTLTLNAKGNIYVSAVMSATGSASLAFNPGTLQAGSATTPGTVAMQFTTGGSGFAGRVDFDSTGTLSVGGKTYTQIRTQSDLQNMSLTGYYFLGSDLALSGAFTPIGLVAGNTGSFTGIFDGLGHQITGLEINLPGTNNVGLFSSISSKAAIPAIVRNVGVVLGNAGVSGDWNVGGLAGSLDALSMVMNSYVSGTGAVSGASDTIGGLIGNAGSVAYSYSTVAVNAPNATRVGGLIGYGMPGNTSYGAGYAYLYATGAVTGANNVGGLFGVLAGTVFTAYAAGAVVGVNYVGGLAGATQGGSSKSSGLYDTYSTSAVTGKSYVGGLVGQADSLGITESYFSGTITQLNGGLADTIGSVVGSGTDVRQVGTGWIFVNSDNLPNGMKGIGYNGNSSPIGTGISSAQMSDPTFWSWRNGFSVNNMVAASFGMPSDASVNSGFPVLCAFSACPASSYPDYKPNPSSSSSGSSSGSTSSSGSGSSSGSTSSSGSGSSSGSTSSSGSGSSSGSTSSSGSGSSSGSTSSSGSGSSSGSTSSSGSGSSSGSTSSSGSGSSSGSTSSSSSGSSGGPDLPLPPPPPPAPAPTPTPAPPPLIPPSSGSSSGNGGSSSSGSSGGKDNESGSSSG
ncbi:filamentous hemagglutinin N-terminal domain-containing protein, partial [Pandoraea bronchicola]|uniref:two-partner secretion domain-containing protein n=1 Tax=Pandoraea bronchicola TaxID=2508287 RepID=UPI00124135AE